MGNFHKALTELWDNIQLKQQKKIVANLSTVVYNNMAYVTSQVNSLQSTAAGILGLSNVQSSVDVNKL